LHFAVFVRWLIQQWVECKKSDHVYNHCESVVVATIKSIDQVNKKGQNTNFGHSKTP